MGTRRVLILTPRGEGGVGGIDRLMDSLREEAGRLAPGIDLAFATTRGRSILFSPAYTALAALRIVAARIARQIDAVHVNLSSNASAYRKAALAEVCRALGVPYVIHLHGADFASFWPTDCSRRRRMIDRLFLGAAAVIVLGTPWERLMRDRLPELGPRLHVIPNASPAPRPRPAARGPGDPTVRVLFLGELGQRKGSSLLLQALAMMRPVAPWRAVLAGEGAISQTRRAAGDLGLSDRVEVPGWVGREGVAELLATSDILVLPSFSENLPLSVIEAMGAGLAVVATPVGAVADIVRDGETGCLVPPGDTSALVQALERLIDDSDLRRRLGATARAFHRKHLDVPVFADRLAAVWRHASGCRGR